MKISESNFKNLTTWKAQIIEHSFEVFNWCRVISILNDQKPWKQGWSVFAVFLILILLISNRYNFADFYTTALKFRLITNHSMLFQTMSMMSSITAGKRQSCRPMTKDVITRNEAALSYNSSKTKQLSEH
jgi:hypothetical protein